MLLCGPQGYSSGRGIGWRWLAWQGVVRGSNQPDDQKNGRAPVGTCPVGLHDTPLRTTSGRGGIKTSVANKFEDGVFVRGVDTLVFEDFGCTDAIGIAGLGLCGFHYLNRASIARRSPRFPMGTPGRFKPIRRNAGDPYRGQGCKEPAGHPAHPRRLGNRSKGSRPGRKRRGFPWNDDHDRESHETCSTPCCGRLLARPWCRRMPSGLNAKPEARACAIDACSRYGPMMRLRSQGQG